MQSLRLHKSPCCRGPRVLLFQQNTFDNPASYSTHFAMLLGCCLCHKFKGPSNYMHPLLLQPNRRARDPSYPTTFSGTLCPITSANERNPQAAFTACTVAGTAIDLYESAVGAGWWKEPMEAARAACCSANSTEQERRRGGSPQALALTGPWKIRENWHQWNTCKYQLHARAE